MKKIDNQMNIISETIMKLSEQNRTIGEITSSVADIADQSNLLAVNAAIEAAKAGEHGRGFAVVAQEIRSLAEQSKKATAQVKEIINEIQKSVSLAVDVTGKGSRTVEDGIRLVKQSGEVIEILAENVDEAAQSFIQISSSSQQQMAGMEQIVPAMENIKQASEQNVSGIKQTQIAAHNLNWPGFGKNEEDWLGFVFRIDQWSGEPYTANDEGTLEWVAVSDLQTLNLWDSDRLWIEMVFANDYTFHGVAPYKNGKMVNWSYSKIAVTPPTPA
jgi:hypothetical protein